MVATAETRAIAALKHAQANAIALYLNAKRYHWFTYGPLFRDLHQFFDELANDALAEFDPLAERLRMLGGEPLSTPRQIEAWASVAIADGRPSPREMLEEVQANELRVVTELRDAARLADDEPDPGTNDLLSTLVQVHQKHAWFVAELLRKDDGLVSWTPPALQARSRTRPAEAPAGWLTRDQPSGSHASMDDPLASSLGRTSLPAEEGRSPVIDAEKEVSR